MPEWIQGLLAIGAGTGGPGILAIAAVQIARSFAAHREHRARQDAEQSAERASLARTGEINAAITQDAWDTMVGRLKRHEDRIAALERENSGLREIVDQLLEDLTELRKVVSTGRGSVPPMRLYESLRPPAVEVNGNKNGGDKR